MKNILKGAGVVAGGGALWGAYLQSARSAPLVLRPPGALPEDRLQAVCTKCGLCVVACPYGSLMLGKPGEEGRPVGTPFFIPREKPCYLCPDIPCVVACPTGALSPELVSGPVEGNNGLNINLARMGLAVIDRETCIACWGMQCDVCYRACPLMDRAIRVEYARNERTGKHAFLAPVVDSRHCTGCGICEHACVTEKASIFVLPTMIAQGKSYARYLRGWTKEDEKRLHDAPADTTTVTPRSDEAPVDYLNRGEF